MHLPIHAAQGATWNEMTVSWTSGYGISEAEPSVEWGRKGGHLIRSPAGTQTLKRSTMCGIHTSWDIGSSIVHIFGVTNTSLEHLLILVKIHDSVLSFLVTWERAKWMVLVNIIFSLALLTLRSSSYKT